MSPVHTILSYFSKIHLNLSSHLHLGLLMVSVLLAFQPEYYMHYTSPHACYVLCQSHHAWLGYSNYICRRPKIMKLLIMQCSPTSYTSSLFSQNIPLVTLFWNTISLCSSLNVRDQVPHPQKTTGKIIVLYILIFTFVYRLMFLS
jgi:hypothetical protein